LIVKNQNGEVIWDTQELEIKAKMQPYSLNQFGFEVRKWDPWHVTKSITWVPEGYIKLYDKIYRGEAELHVDNATVYVKGIGYIENNDYSSDPGLIPIEEDGEGYYLLQQETSGNSFMWEFDAKIITLSGDGPFFSFWLKDKEADMPINPYKIEYTYTVIALKNGKNATLHGLNLDKSWLRQFSNVPLKTVVLNIDTGEAYIEGKITGSVAGIVYDDLGNPIENAVVTLNGYTVTTNLTGWYLLTNIPTGNYTIKASKQGYYPQTKSIQILENQTLLVNFTLSKDREAPIIKQVYREPENVEPNQVVKVFAEVSDEGTGLTAVILSYSINGGIVWHNVTMKHLSGIIYMGEIPGFPAGTTVSYKVIAYDYAGNFAIEDNMGNLYTYTIISEFPTMLMPLILITLILVGLVTIFIIKNKIMPINEERSTMRASTSR